METYFSSPHVTTAAAAVLVTYIAVRVYQWNQERLRKQKLPWKMVPGWLPVVGHFHHIGSLEQLVPVLEEWSNQYGAAEGCFEMDLAGQPSIVICRDDRAREVLQYRPACIHHSAEMNEAAVSCGLTGVFTAEGRLWSSEKKVVSAALNTHNVKEYLSVFKTVTNRLLDKWEKELGPNNDTGVVDLASDIKGVVADSISKVSMGRDFDCINTPHNKVATDIESLTTAILIRVFSPIRYWRIPLIGQYLDGKGFAIRRIRQFLVSVIEEEEESARNDETKATSSTSNNKTYLSKLIQLSQQDKARTMERGRLAGNILTLFSAGIDTTAKILDHVLYLLTRNQTLQQTLAAEAATLDLETASLSDLRTKLPQLKAFLHECHLHYGGPMQLVETVEDDGTAYSTSSSSNNKTTKRVATLCGVPLPVGTKLILLSTYMSTSPVSPSKLIPLGPNGELPSEFCPTRYLVKDDDNGQLLSCPDPPTDGIAFGGFGLGVRTCPGRVYAECLSLCLLVAILQHFQLDFPDQMDPAATTLPSASNSNDNCNKDGYRRIYDMAMVPDWKAKVKLTKRGAMGGS